MEFEVVALNLKCLKNFKRQLEKAKQMEKEMKHTKNYALITSNAILRHVYFTNNQSGHESICLTEYPLLVCKFQICFVNV